MATDPTPLDMPLQERHDAKETTGAGSESGDFEPLLPDAREPEHDTAELTAVVGQETDVWWGAYSGRTMGPTFAHCALVSLAIGALSAWLWNEEQIRAQVLWHLSVLAILAVWCLPLWVWGHRTVSRNYRLTTRRLYRDNGFRRPADGQVELADVTQVRFECTALERRLAVGRIIVDTDGKEAFVLDGVHEPERVAALIRQWAERARRTSAPGKAQQ